MMGSVVQVKPLFWRQWYDNPEREYARGPIGEGYHASDKGWWHALAPLNKCDGIEAAKAAAQEDYEARVRSALVQS